MPSPTYPTVPVHNPAMRYVFVFHFVSSPAYAFGPVVAGHLVENFGFTTLNVVVGVISLIYAPIIFYLKDMHKSANNTEPMQGPG